MTIDEFLELLRMGTDNPHIAERLRVGREYHGEKAVRGWQIHWGNEILLDMGPDITEGREGESMSPFSVVAHCIGRETEIFLQEGFPARFDVIPEKLGLTKDDGELLRKAIEGDPRYHQNDFPLLTDEQRSLRERIKVVVGLEGQKDGEPLER